MNTDNILQTPQQFVANNPAFKMGGLRNLLFFRNTNGLVSSGAVCNIGRKLLINVPKCLAWLESNPQPKGVNNDKQ